MELGDFRNGTRKERGDGVPCSYNKSCLSWQLDLKFGLHEIQER